MRFCFKGSYTYLNGTKFTGLFENNSCKEGILQLALEKTEYVAIFNTIDLVTLSSLFDEGSMDEGKPRVDISMKAFIIFFPLLCDRRHSFQ